MDMDKIKSSLPFYQTLLSLLRDGVLTMMAILTVVIFSLGGDPKSMSPVDWAKLVSLAFGIIIFPIISFFITRWFLISISTIGAGLRYITGIDSSVPKGIYAFIFLAILRLKKRNYIYFWRRVKYSPPRLDRLEITRFIGKISLYFDKIVLKIYPTLASVAALIVAGKIFSHAVNSHIPISINKIITIKASIFLHAVHNYLQAGLH